MTEHVERDAVTGTETTGHEWDGIKELNTPLPTWWLYTFYATIVFAIVWCIFYPALPGSEGLLQHTERRSVARTMSEASVAQKPFIDRINALSMDEIRKDRQLMAFATAGGRAAFGNNCAPCHQAGGAGTRGFPNLADDDWIWGGTFGDIERTIRFGIRSEHDETRTSLMPRFGVDGILDTGQIDDVVEHVRALSKLEHDAARAARGSVVYAENCASCHMPDGAGKRELGAPALNDAVWLQGSDRATIRSMIVAPRIGMMPMWQGRLDDATIKMLTIYVHGLGGGN